MACTETCVPYAWHVWRRVRLMYGMYGDVCTLCMACMETCVPYVWHVWRRVRLMYGMYGDVCTLCMACMETCAPYVWPVWRRLYGAVAESYRNNNLLSLCMQQLVA